MDAKLLLMLIGIAVAGVLGFLIGRNYLKPKGEICYEVYLDEDEKEAVRCTFKMDLDVDDIVKEDYILLEVTKDKAVRTYYEKQGVKFD